MASLLGVALATSPGANAEEVQAGVREDAEARRSTAVAWLVDAATGQPIDPLVAPLVHVAPRGQRGGR